jgi:hypothetical protein
MPKNESVWERNVTLHMDLEKLFIEFHVQLFEFD